jgi:hypothetical protein
MLPEEHLQEAMQQLTEAAEHTGLRALEEQRANEARQATYDALAMVAARRGGLEDCEVLTDDGGEQA